MKLIKLSATFLVFLFFISCGGSNDSTEQENKGDNKPAPRAARKEKAEKEEVTEEVRPSQRIDLESKGVGPIKSLDLPADIDQDLVAKGIEVYNGKCTACHKVDKRLVGPAPAGILNRRTPEWIMNMILNPEEMVKEDPLAKELFLEFNGSPMSNQNLTQEEARAVLEYFRTL